MIVDEVRMSRQFRKQFRRGVGVRNAGGTGEGAPRSRWWEFSISAAKASMCVRFLQFLQRPNVATVSRGQFVYQAVQVIGHNVHVGVCAIIEPHTLQLAVNNPLADALL